VYSTVYTWTDIIRSRSLVSTVGRPFNVLASRNPSRGFEIKAQLVTAHSAVTCCATHQAIVAPARVQATRVC